MNYRSVADLTRCIVTNSRRIPGDIEVVVGIPRSGLLAANLVALQRNLPLADIDGLLEGRLLASGGRLTSEGRRDYLSSSRRVLVVDDSILSARTMLAAKKQLEVAMLPHRYVFMAVYAVAEGTSAIDLWLEEVPEPRMFEWNILHHPLLSRCCVDIDGVLCSDPSSQENDDGPMYAHFLANAEPLFTPKFKIGYLVTSRLEKYRQQTEHWLHAHGIRYDHLVMLDLPTKEARLASRSHAAFKAAVYGKTNTLLFIESSAAQAQEISGRTGRPAFCVESWRFERGSYLGLFRNYLHYRLSSYSYRLRSRAKEVPGLLRVKRWLFGSRNV